MGRRKKDWDIPLTQQHELKLMKKQLKLIKLLSKSDRQLRLLRRKNDDLILAENQRAAAAAAQSNTPTTSEAATDSNQVSVDNTVDVLDSADAIMDTVAPKDSNDSIMDSNVTIMDSGGPTLMEQGFDASYQPSYDHDPFEYGPEVEPTVPVHLISHVHEQLQADWEETEKRLNEKRKRRKKENREARQQSEQEHLDWWTVIEPTVCQSYEKYMSEKGKLPFSNFDSDDFSEYCDCNCAPRCEIQLICIVGSFS
jgi:hypothetical protein